MKVTCEKDGLESLRRTLPRTACRATQLFAFCLNDLGERNQPFELLDVDPSSTLAGDIRATLEALDDVRVRDLHFWSLGGGAKSCAATVISAEPREVDRYRERLARFELAHLTIEVQRCLHGHRSPLVS